MIPLFTSNDASDWGNLVGVNGSYYDPAFVDNSLAFGDDGIRPMSSNHAPAVGDVTWYHMRVTLTGSFVNNDDGYFLGIKTAAGDTIARFEVSNGNYYAQCWGDSAPLGATFRFGAWATYALDMKVTVNGAGVSFAAYLNGGLVSSCSTTNGVGKSKPQRLDLDTVDAMNGGTFYVSEIIISEQDTRGARLARRNFVTAGQYSDMVGVPADLGDDNDVTGYSSDTTGQRVSNTIGAYSVNGPIAAVVLATRAEKSGSPAKLKQFLRIAATDYEGALTTLTDSPENYFDVWEINPDTGVPWTPVDVSGVEGGAVSQA